MRPADRNRPGGPGHYSQENTPAAGGTVYAHQGPGDQIIYAPPTQGTPVKRGVGVDTKVLLATLVTDVLFFFYGMLSYSGTNSGADTWRAGIFLLLLAVTGTMIRRWIRRRM